jgi:hypothetical protein
MTTNPTFTLRITHVMPVHQVTDTFKKKEIIGIMQPENEKYPCHLKVTAKQAKADEITEIQVGDTVSFQCFLEGRLWEKEGKINVFTDLALNSYRIMSKGNGQSAAQQQPQGQPEPDPEMPWDPNQEVEADLPF